VPEPVASAEFRRLMGRWATGVSVVTAREGPVDYGLTVNALLSVSLAPPLLLASLTHDADTTPVILRTGWFAAHLLAHDQRPLSERFASMAPPSEKFHGVPTHRLPNGMPALDGALASFECRLDRSFPVEDHRLLVGRVESFEAGRDVAPLLFFRSHYGESEGEERVRLAPPPSRPATESI
jgi:flavin reductase (DIM6/NTAB) family NADH-FMN oxidoreductase RutF